MSLSLFEQQRTATRYASAFYALSKDAGKQDVAAQELQQLVTLYHESDAFHNLCHSPLISAESRVASVSAIAEQAKADEITTSFMKKLAENNRLSLLPHILEAFTALQQKDAGEVVVQFISADALKAAEKKELEKSVSDALGHKVIAEYEEDASLIAGVKIRYGSRELDASVKGTLRRAAARFTQSIQQTSS